MVYLPLLTIWIKRESLNSLFHASYCVITGLAYTQITRHHALHHSSKHRQAGTRGLGISPVSSSQTRSAFGRVVRTRSLSNGVVLCVCESRVRDIKIHIITGQPSRHLFCVYSLLVSRASLLCVFTLHTFALYPEDVECNM